jgi:hypothetical protein
MPTASANAMVETVNVSETSVYFNQTTRRYIPDSAGLRDGLGRDMAQAVSRWSPTAEARVRARLCTKWHWDRFFSEFFGFPLSVSFHRGSILIYLGKNIRPVVAAVQSNYNKN